MVKKLNHSTKFRLPSLLEKIITPFFLIACSLLYTGHHLYRYRTLTFDSMILNQFVQNAPYSFLTDIYRSYKMQKKGIPKYYHFGSKQAGVLHFKQTFNNATTPFILDNNAKNLYRMVNYPTPVTGAPNVVIFLMEGFSAVSVEALTPNGHKLATQFEKLAQDGLLFTQIYGHGRRSHNGIVSTLSGYPSLLALMLTRKSGNAAYYSIASLLKDKGYDTSFFNSYNSSFDDNDLFVSGAGIDKVFDLKSFKHPKFTGRWGVSDEDLYIKANQYFIQQQRAKKPFFSLLVNTSNHFPYKVPDYFYKEHPEYKVNGEQGYPATFAYADWAIGEFFKMASTEEYFKNTIFVVISDHGEAVDQTDKFMKSLHIPMLIYSPHLIKQPMVIHKVGGQADLIPTLLPMIGHSGSVPFLGEDLLKDPHAPGKVMTRIADTGYYREGDQVLEWDMKLNKTRAFLIDQYSYLQVDKPLDASAHQRLKQNAGAYMEAVSQIFTKAQFRKPPPCKKLPCR